MKRLLPAALMVVLPVVGYMLVLVAVGVVTSVLAVLAFTLTRVF